MAGLEDSCYFAGLREDGSYRRWCVALSAWLVVFAGFAGATLTYQTAWGLEKFGGLEWVSRVAAISISRVIAATAVFKAGLFAWITWAHGVDAVLVRESFRPTALRAMLAAAFGATVVLGAVISLGDAAIDAAFP